MAKKKTESEFSFEASFEELQEIVTNLEEGNLTLSDSLKNYETGIKRLKECYAALNSAEQKIRQLAEIDEDGNLVTTQFSTDSATEKKKSGGKNSKKSAKKPPTEDELF
jgi:exodeoxyribonuclease VII small subunit